MRTRAMKRLIAASLLLACLPPAAGVATAQPGPSTLSSLRVDAPRIDRTGALVLVGLGTAAWLSRSFEDADRTAQLIDRTTYLDTGIDIADAYGAGQTLGLTALGMMAAGHLAGNENLAGAGCDLSSSLLTAWAVTWAVKLAVDEERPNGGRYSFPSGHTSTAFAAAPVFAAHYGRTAGIAAYSVAALTGLARMEDRKHYLADVLAGAAIGCVAGRAFAGGAPLRIATPQHGAGLGLSLGF